MKKVKSANTVKVGDVITAMNSEHHLTVSQINKEGGLLSFYDINGDYIPVKERGNVMEINK
jgi:hypothetical protein